MTVAPELSLALELLLLLLLLPLILMLLLWLLLLLLLLLPLPLLLLLLWLWLCSKMSLELAERRILRPTRRVMVPGCLPGLLTIARRSVSIASALFWPRNETPLTLNN